MSDSKNDGQGGQYKRFSGESLDGRELRKWRLWCEAKMASLKDFDKKQKGPWVFTLLDGLALETVEHLTLTELVESDGDKHIWKLLEERFPDKLQHDLLAECLREVFSLSIQDGEGMAAWTSRVQESFAKCRRKVSVDFPSEARGWVVLNCSGLSPDQRAIVVAKSAGDLRFDVVVSSLRSCFPDYVASSKGKKPSAVYAVNDFEDALDEPFPESGDFGDSVIFEEVEALLADHGVKGEETSEATFDETDVVEILAASWKEKRSEISRLQKSRNFRQLSKVKQNFKEEVRDLEKRTRCHRCGKVGHWARNCSKPKGYGKGSSSASSDKPNNPSGAAMVMSVEQENKTEKAEVLLVSSPGFGVIDSGCGKTLIGQETLNKMLKIYQKNNLPQPILRRHPHLFAFGNNVEEATEFVVKLDIGINGRRGSVEAAIIKGPAPLLLSRGTMKSLDAKLDFGGETLALGSDPPQKVQVNPAGQFVIDVMNFPGKKEVLVLTEDSNQCGDCVEFETVRSNQVPKNDIISENKDVITPQDCPDEVLAGVSRNLTRREARCLLSKQPAWTKGDSKCLVAELFSPPRFAKLAREKGFDGLSYDILQGCDLLDKKTQAEVSKQLDEANPELLVLSPECKHWGGWYRLNQTKLSLVEQVTNKKKAEAQATFCVAQAKRQIKRGGRVLLEHPWSSGLWSFPPVKKLLKQMRLCKASMCAYDLKCPDSGLPILKNTGLAVSHEDMVSRAAQCPGHSEHRVIAGQCNHGNTLSSYTAAYTPKFVETWLSCVLPQSQLCHFTQLEDPGTMPSDSRNTHGHGEEASIECFAGKEIPVEQIQLSIKKLHNNLGHPDQRNLLRVLKNAGASPQAIDLASKFKCEICQQRQRPTPCLPSSIHSIVDFNHRVGLDVKQLPGWNPNQKVKCLNIVDWASSFQVMVPFYEVETGQVIKTIFLERWASWAGFPTELLMDPARTNQSDTFVSVLEDAGVRVLTTAAEAHNQLGKVEKHGHLFEVVFQKVLDQMQPSSRDTYDQCIVQTMSAKNEMINLQGLSPCQHVFGRNPRVPGDLVQESPNPVAGNPPIHDSTYARSQAIRTAARISLIQAQDDQTLRAALSARPRAERDFLAGDFVYYWRTQKFQRGVRLVGGRWYGAGIVIGKVGRNILVHHRRNMFKVSPEHLRHATLEERAVAQSDGRELLGIASMVGEKGDLQSSQYVDLTGQELPEQPDQLNQGSHLRAESVDDATPVADEVRPSVISAPDTSPHVPSPSNTTDSQPSEQATGGASSSSHLGARSEPFSNKQKGRAEETSTEYGPIRYRHYTKKPEALFRPPGTEVTDFMEACEEVSREKRASSRVPSVEPPSKAARTDEMLFVVDSKSSESVEVFLANFLKKKMTSELHHSNNPPEVQEAIDESKVTEWLTLQDEKRVISVVDPKSAIWIRKHKGDRIMSSRFVITKKVEDGDTRMKSRWCLRGHHDPDLVQKVISGRCHSPTLSQLGRNILLQLIVSFKWDMKLGDIKGAFLEADVKAQCAANPVYAELPPGGVPGIPHGSLVQVLGNIYGANDAPHNWYKEFDTVAQSVGFTKSRFDSCLYFCFGPGGKLEGVMGAHVDDTITGGMGSHYDAAVQKLRDRFPFRKWRSGEGEFLGVVYSQCPKTKVIKYNQKDYANNIQPIKLSKERSREHWKHATDREIAALRAVNGALGWLSGQSRPDLAVQTSISQQSFPNPTVEHLLLANQAVRRARQHADLEITVPFIPPKELTICFWSDAAFANAVNHRTQGGWIVGLTSDQLRNGVDSPVSVVGWKSYKLPRVVSSTLAGEAQCFASTSGIAEWCSLILAEALEGPFSLDRVDHMLSLRSPIGMTDCRSLYDHLITLGTGGTLDDKRVAIDIAVIRQSIARTKLEPRWIPTDRMVADGLTKDKGEPLDLLRSVLRTAQYQLADEQLVLDRKKEERERRKLVGKTRQNQKVSPGSSPVCSEDHIPDEHTVHELLA